MKKFEINHCGTLDDVRRVVSSSFKGEEVVSGYYDAVKRFREAGIDGDVVSRLVYWRQVSVYDEVRHGEVVCNVSVYEYYVDSASLDYLYSYNIVEL